MASPRHARRPVAMVLALLVVALIAGGAAADNIDGASRTPGCYKTRNVEHTSQANGKDQDLYTILYKGQSGNGQADGKPQWSPSKGRTADNKDGKHSQTYDPVDTSCFASSVHYGGRDYYGSPAAMQAAESSNEYKVGKKDPATDSHGDWWQGSFYY